MGPRLVCLWCKGSVLTRLIWETEIKGKQSNLRRPGRGKNTTQYLEDNLTTKYAMKAFRFRKTNNIQVFINLNLQSDQLFTYFLTS